MFSSIGFGGGCHWCTEAVFQALVGVVRVDQGWISSFDENDTFSEAVIVDFNPEIIKQKTLIEIHLLTHASTVMHSMREKYRSAVYIFNEPQAKEVKASISEIQKNQEAIIITEVLFFNTFRRNKESFLDYYKKRPEAPFCKTNIIPKLKKLQQTYKDLINDTHFNTSTTVDRDKIITAR